MLRLRHVGSDALTITRRRKGRGYVYVHASGRRVGDSETRARIQHLAIPPAWDEVRIAAYPLAHIQACGTDAAGRLQYIYHPEWEVRRTRRRQRHLAALVAALPSLRRRVRRDLEREAGDRTLALAIAVALIDRTAMRVGRERYLVSNGTRGAGTLYARDVAVRGDEIRIRFPSKGGKTASYVIEDGKLAAAMSRIKSLRGRRLLMHRDAGTGKLRAIRTGEINAYLREIAGAPVRAKDFRTLHASALAGEALARLEPGPTPSARKRQVAAVMREVANFLQNTPAVSRQSYVAPMLLSMFETGTLHRRWCAGATSSARGLAAREARLAGFLGTA